MAQNEKSQRWPDVVRFHESYLHIRGLNVMHNLDDAQQWAGAVIRLERVLERLAPASVERIINALCEESGEPESGPKLRLVG